MAKAKTLRVLSNTRKSGGPARKPGILARLLALILLSISLGVVLTAQDASAAATYLAWKKGSFTKATATGNQSINDVGFQPKAVIFYWTRQTATGQAANISAGYGFTTGALNERVIAISSDDTAADSVTRRRQSDAKCVILLSNGTPTLGAEAELYSFDSGGFTLNWTTNESRADIIHYIALGGSDLTNALASSFTLTSGSGSQSVNTVGFQPDFLMFLSIDSTSLNANIAEARASIGFASSSTEEASIATIIEDAQAKSDTYVRQRTDSCLNEITTNGGENMLANLTSFDSGGFTIQKTAADATVVHFLALKGGRYKVGSFNKSTTTSTPVDQAVSTVGFLPVGVALVSKNLVTNSSSEANARVTFGAGDTTAEGTTWWLDEDNDNTMEANNITKTDNVFVHANAPGTTILSEADLKSADSNGFTLTWTTNNNIGIEILYVAFGHTGGVTAVNLSSFTAKSDGEHVALEWKTGYEVNNLGFHVYREENGELFRVTPELVAGSAFLTGSGTPLTAGSSYSWIDALPFASPNAERRTPYSSLSTQHSALSTFKYYLEDWDLSGKHTLHGPVTPVRSDVPLLKYGNATLLSELGKRQNQKYNEFWRIQEIREKLQQSAALGSPNAELRTPYSSLGTPNAELRTPNDFLSMPQAERSSSASGPAQQALASQTGIKIGVREQGWHRVTQSELVAAGLDPGVDPRRLRLFVDGEEQAILVLGETDGRFDANDSIEFYGTGQDTSYSDTRIYWLTDGAGRGKRIKAKKSKNGGSVSQSFPHTVEIKERTVYFAALKNGDIDNFFGAIVSSAGADQILNITNLGASAPGDALLEVILQGGTSTTHRVKVFVNDAEVMEMQFEGMVRRIMSVVLPQSHLLEGDNIVSLVAQAGQADISVVDTLRLTYWHTYAADQDSLLFPASSGHQVAIDGFSSPDIRVVEVTDPRKVREVVGGIVAPEDPAYSIRFRTTGGGNRSFLAFTEATIKSAASITPNQPSTYHRTNSRAELVIIAHSTFIDSLGPLKSLRESQGWSVALVDVEDLYDEFNFGTKSPHAIKDFIGNARDHWQKPPRFVLLVGDASFDPRNYLGLGDVDFLPTKLIDTAANETASDEWFVDFYYEGPTTIPVGRLPVRTPEEATLVVSKIMAYENAPAGTWVRQATMVSDKIDGEGDFDFEEASAEVEALLPEDITAQKISRAQGDDETGRTLLINAINEGRLLVNYIGHGSVEIWRGGIFNSDDVASLTNGSRLPFFIAMTCLNGYFHDPFPTESLAEALLKAGEGGAIAIWASTGLTYPEGQSRMDKELISLLFDGRAITLGEATVKAKVAAKDVDVRRTWILFGDPTTRLKY